MQGQPLEAGGLILVGKGYARKSEKADPNKAEQVKPEQATTKQPTTKKPTRPQRKAAGKVSESLVVRRVKLQERPKPKPKPRSTDFEVELPVKSSLATTLKGHAQQSVKTLKEKAEVAAGDTKRAIFDAGKTVRRTKSAAEGMIQQQDKMKAIRLLLLHPAERERPVTPPTFPGQEERPVTPSTEPGQTDILESICDTLSSKEDVALEINRLLNSLLCIKKLLPESAGETEDLGDSDTLTTHLGTLQKDFTAELLTQLKDVHTQQAQDDINLLLDHGELKDAGIEYDDGKLTIDGKEFTNSPVEALAILTDIDTATAVADDGAAYKFTKEGSGKIIATPVMSETEAKTIEDIASLLIEGGRLHNAGIEYYDGKLTIDGKEFTNSPVEALAILTDINNNEDGQRKQRADTTGDVYKFIGSVGEKISASVVQDGNLERLLKPAIDTFLSRHTVDTAFVVPTSDNIEKESAKMISSRKGTFMAILKEMQEDTALADLPERAGLAQILGSDEDQDSFLKEMIEDLTRGGLQLLGVPSPVITAVELMKALNSDKTSDETTTKMFAKQEGIDQAEEEAKAIIEDEVKAVIKEVLDLSDEELADSEELISMLVTLKQGNPDKKDMVKALSEFAFTKLKEKVSEEPIAFVQNSVEYLLGEAMGVLEHGKSLTGKVFMKLIDDDNKQKVYKKFIETSIKLKAKNMMGDPFGVEF